MNYVYSIKIDNVVRYIGRTNNLKRRTYQHNYCLKKGHDKLFYNYLRQINYKKDLKIDIISSHKSVTDAKRVELFLILLDWIYKKELMNKIPPIR